MPISTRQIAVRSVDLDKSKAVITFTDGKTVNVPLTEEMTREVVEKIHAGDIAYLAYNNTVEERTEKDLLFIDIHVSGGSGNEIVELSIKHAE